YQNLPELFKTNSGTSTGFDQTQVYPDFEPAHSNNTCAFVTITRGCDNYCSYCIVPFVRGRERSVPFESIYKEVENCGRQGLKDVTLLGQNVNSYSYKGMNFPRLLRELNQIESIYRLRFLTSHPKDLSDELIQTMADCDKICHHIHLPMQSGDNHILRSMNRKYSYDSYYNLTEKLRITMPDIGLTTDLIAGFPSETEAMFEHTLDAMKSIRFDYAFCFKYSEREGTPASGWPDQVPEEIRLERLQRMIDLQREITLEKFSARIGRFVEIYVENLSKKSRRQVSGKTDDFKIAVMTGDESDIGKLKRSKVVDATAGTLICE
ncbi:MAG: MiaB/RimO family radical SAM methylthiotransferase, partial [Candidatus Syntrophosphaera sp.]